MGVCANRTAKPSSTIGPLHLEDLDPHRFEDLVRQLVYEFRNWRQLEATGRSGSDEGFDARGWEVVGDTAAERTEEEEDDDNAIAGNEDRLWLIQCKREKEIGPKKLMAYLDQIPKNQEIYGLVFAAACDFSKTARDDFRSKVIELKFGEAFLWGKGELEDQLFQPKNDHLLFAYCGISLQLRRRSLKTQVRVKLSTKRKAKRALSSYGPALVRDASDERYPNLDPDTRLIREERGRWKTYMVDGCKWDGVHIVYQRHYAFLGDDNEQWDYAETMDSSHNHAHSDPWDRTEVRETESQKRAREVWNALPEQNKAWYQITRVIPYESILDIDEEGDEYFSRPHIYVSDPPFRNYESCSLETIDPPRRSAYPSDQKRTKVFPRADDPV